MVKGIVKLILFNGKDFSYEPTHILNSVILKVYTEVPQLSENSSLVPDSEFYVKKIAPVYLQYSP
jgi:hypothetical protein